MGECELYRDCATPPRMRGRTELPIVRMAGRWEDTDTRDRREAHDLMVGLIRDDMRKVKVKEVGRGVGVGDEE